MNRPNFLAASRILPYGLVARAKLVLWSAEGQRNTQIARRLHWRNSTVGKWRQRFLQHRLAGLARSPLHRVVHKIQCPFLVRRSTCSRRYPKRGFCRANSTNRVRSGSSHRLVW